MVKAGVSSTFPVGARKLIKAIHRAVEGENLLTEAQIERVRQWEENNSGKLKKLTEREREILSWMSSGLKNADISMELGITHHTTEFHITNILKKLGVTTRQQAIVWVSKNFGDELKTG
jgi:two-component system nitrate/nitrite response regulator NarL